MLSRMSEHVCSVVLVLLALLLWRWMFLSSPRFFSVIPLCVLWFLCAVCHGHGAVCARAWAWECSVILPPSRSRSVLCVCSEVKW